MRSIRNFVRRALPLCSLLAVASWAGPATAQVREVVVGITPTCPYGLAVCWAGAYEALGRMEGVESVDRTPNADVCTAAVRVKGGRLPDPEKWASQFKAMVDEAYAFRGVEVTVSGTLEGGDDGLVLRVPGVETQIAPGPLRHKLQWNPKEVALREPETDERDAYQQLASRVKDAKGEGLKVQMTGPLTKSDRGYTLEVRAFSPRTPDAD
jgi:galactose oxidase